MSIDFRFHYSQTEDRLAITAGNGNSTAVMYLTRFLTERFLNALGNAIEKTSPAIRSTPAHSAEVLAFEHEQALVQTTGGTDFTPVPSTLPQDKTYRLVSTIDIKPLAEGRLQIVFRNKDDRLAMELAQDTLHVMHSQILGLATHANWKLDIKTPWLFAATPGGADASKLTH